jgi:tRNA threonylcarbamoyladenosine biosynthesis protein TsaE
LTDPRGVRDTAGPGETEVAGAGLAAVLEPGDVVFVGGELGSGKTTFVRGACRALGVAGPVTSPTFTLGRRYAGRVAVAHLDLDRLGPGGLAAEDPALLADYLDSGTVVFVEWPGHGAGALPAPRFSVLLEHAGGDHRRVTVR